MSFISYNGATAASKVPNSESIPKRSNMMKNRTDQSGEASIRRNASQNVIKARPAPLPTLGKNNGDILSLHPN